jgi:hypothetical protein
MDTYGRHLDLSDGLLGSPAQGHPLRVPPGGSGAPHRLLYSVLGQCPFELNRCGIRRHRDRFVVEVGPNITPLPEIVRRATWVNDP